MIAFSRRMAASLFVITRIVLMWDEANRTLVYLAISRKLIDGAPANSISTLPIMLWGGDFWQP